MVNQITLLLALSLLPAQFSAVRPNVRTGSGPGSLRGQPAWGGGGSDRISGAAQSPVSNRQRPTAEESAKIETNYDLEKDKTTIRLAPIKISGEQDKYHSLHMSPYFSFPGHRPVTPSIVDFELQTVVKGRLSTDLYVVFIIDGETVFLSSNRWAIKRPVPGRVWVGERLVFSMPYETFLKITKAKTFEIKFDGVKFSVGETQKQALREFLTYMKPSD